MKTFEEIKKKVFDSESQGLRVTNAMIEKARLENDKLLEAAGKRSIETIHTSLDNIDECTAIYIGSCTNHLIESIKKAHDIYTLEYYKDFDAFLKKYILASGAGAFIDAQSYCLHLGVGIKELQCFKGCDPNKDEPGDLFRQIINVNYGTNIPMAADLRYVKQEELATSENDKDLVYGKEILRDAGDERVYRNGLFYPLAVDQEYQEAKARISGKTI